MNIDTVMVAVDDTLPPIALALIDGIVSVAQADRGYIEFTPEGYTEFLVQLVGFKRRVDEAQRLAATP